MTHESIQLAFRETVVKADIRHVGNIVRSTGFFTEAEAGVAEELVEDHLQFGIASGYYFVFAEHEKQTIGYCCFGPIACTIASFDIYWIAVHAEFRHRRIGKKILQRAEEAIGRMGGRRVYIETSSREQYAPTRHFYLRNGYTAEAELKNFYAPGDHKVMLVREIAPETPAPSMHAPVPVSQPGKALP